jgi:hypothetical protein
MSLTASHRLSKSRYLDGRQCHRLLWWKVHDRKAEELLPSPGDAAFLADAIAAGERARAFAPGGVLVDRPFYDVDGKLADTQSALSAGAKRIYEAAFLEDAVFVAVDILEAGASGFTLVEVKSSLEAKDEHIDDLAVQMHVVRAAGLDVRRVEVMHLNRDCRHPDLSNLFVRADLTAEVERRLPEVPARIAEQLRVLGGPLPKIPTGRHCREPRPCPFVSRCHEVVPADHVSTLYGLRGDRLAAVLSAGYERIGELPPDLVDTDVRRRQYRAIRDGAPVVDRPALKRALDGLRGPLAFLDFETIAPAIPPWPGCRPRGPVPVQMSCHVQDPDGGSRHHAFLADGAGDPRPALAEAVLHATASTGDVLAWYAPFERECIAALAEAVPEHRAALGALAERLVDLLPIVRDHVYHPAFGGSFSLKKVLPALVPGEGYDDLAVADGMEASWRLAELLLMPERVPAGEAAARRADLLRYCEKDTFGLIRLWEVLRTMA